MLDRAGYWLVVISGCFLVGVAFFYSGKPRLSDENGHAPAMLKKQFEGTFVDTIPGVGMTWVMLGILECVVFVIMVLGLRARRAPAGQARGLPLVALALELLAFRVPLLRQTSTANNAGAASLYTYFGSTAVASCSCSGCPRAGRRTGSAPGSRTAGSRHHHDGEAI